MSGPAAKQSNWNVPNALTMLRILLVPLFGWLLLVDDGQDMSMRVWAFVVFLVAIITDKIDGDLARKHDIVTDFGKLMDPIADKALTGMAFIGLSIIGELWWWVTIVVLGREWSITLLRFLIIKYGVMPASRGGKLKTTLQAVALSGFILPLKMLDGGLELVGEVLWWFAAVVMAAAVVVTVVTGFDYVKQAMRIRREGRAAAGRSASS
jgi:CDP-diacylglycerol--glycerol-3-phosphate 3-phosphatidyltransferase